MKKTILAMAATIVTSTLLPAFAQTSAEISTSQKKSALSKFLAKSSLSYYTEFLGPGLMHIDDGRRTGANAWNQLQLTYSLDDSTSLLMSHAFQINQEDRTSDGKEQDRYQSDDFRIGIQKWDSYSKNVRFRNRVRLESASEDYGEVDLDRFIRVRISHLVSATFNNVHNLGLYVEGRKWFYRDADAQENSSQYFIMPSLSYTYSINDKWSLYTSHTLSQEHMANSKDIFQNERTWQGTYLGAYYNVNSKLTLGTLLYMQGGGGADGMKLDDNTAIDIQLSGTIF